MDLCIALSIRLSVRPLIHPLPYKGRSTFATRREVSDTPILWRGQAAVGQSPGLSDSCGGWQ